MDKSSPAVQANLGEAPGRGPKVQDGAAAGVEAVVVEGGEEFQSPAGHPREILTEQFQGGVRTDFLPGLADFHAVDSDAVIGDEALCTGPTGHQAAVDEEPVEADGIHQFQPSRSAKTDSTWAWISGRKPSSTSARKAWTRRLRAAVSVMPRERR